MNKLHLALKPATILGLVIALLFTSSSKLYAQGPNAPEAASFEPIDATDMVNLATGDFTYVLPILNVPSPEGGYPLALAYHAGIAMDQEASWTGLGWNLNAGAINRSINQYPDDYNNSLIAEYFYDAGGTDYIYTLSTGYSAYGAFSVGVGASWGSNKSLGGYVSVGYGLDLGGGNSLGASVRMGTDGVGINLGLSTNVGLTVGVSASTNGGFGGSVGFDTNGTGFSVSTNGSVNISIAQSSGKDNTVSLGLTLSSNGVGFNAGVTNKTGYNVDGGAGGGLHLQFENTISMGDYTGKTSGWNVPIVVPTPVGIFSLSFGKQKFRYYLGKNEFSHVNGPIHFNERLLTATRWQVNCPGGISFQTEDYDEMQSWNSNGCSAYVLDPIDAFMDIYEVPLDGNNLSSSSQIDVADNAIFPSYDKYNVQAQGLSGGMSSRLFENGNLFGHPNKENQSQFNINYFYGSISGGQPNDLRFNSKPYFYFDNEISSYLAVNETNFNSNTSNNVPYHYSNGNTPFAESRQRNSTYIEYFLNEEIKDNYISIKSKGYLLPGSGFSINSNNIPKNGIGAFKITAVDGKTYHYSLPVYNHETVTRTHGTIAARPNENQSYFEKRQLEPYATHWLLTAVTGPDYFDTNNNGFADKGDYGYWTTFEYGKWSDAFVWSAPYGRDYFENEDNNNIKTSIKGRKQVYYLDRVKTRTHTALFIKSSRNDALSPGWNYQSVAHDDDSDHTNNPFQSRFNIPEQEPLKLDKIILVKEEDDTLDASYGSSNQSYTDVHYNNSSKPSEQAWYKLKDNILDVGDNINSILPKAIKIIDLQYDNSLAIGRPYTNGPSYGSSTLKEVHFKGKGGEQLMPPYSFDYNNNTSYSYNINDKDVFGYFSDDNSLWSLKNITTPQGGKIVIDYENHKLLNVIEHKVNFNINENSNSYTLEVESTSPNLIYTIETDGEYGISVGDVLDTEYENIYNCCTVAGQGQLDWNSYTLAGYIGESIVTESLGNNKFRVQSNNPVTFETPTGCSCGGQQSLNFSVDYEISNPISKGGIRVSNLTTTDGNNSYSTKYSYGENENGIGYVTYLPYAPELGKELPYSAELPPPRVLYEYVSLESLGTNNQSEGKIQYKFKVLKEKDPNNIKFGDVYEIETLTDSEHYNATADKDVEIRRFNIKDNLATLGQLLEVSIFNNEGHMLSKIENTYYSPSDATPSSVGVTKEAYQTYKVVDYLNNTSSLKDKWLINSSSRVKYPSLLKSSTEYKGGYEYTSYFGELDPITGQANEVLSVSSNGTEVKSKIVPAYHKYTYSPFTDIRGMGSKVDFWHNKNMLSQITANYSYVKDNISGQWKEINVGISTWNNEWSYRDHAGLESTETNLNAKIWRKHKEYIWTGELNSDGTYNNYIDNFSWNSSSQPSEWKEVSEVTKYTRYSSPMEFKDINNNRASTKMCDEGSKVLVTGNAWYGEMYYTGAEYKEGGIYLDSEIRGASYQTSEKAHTGEYSVKLNPGNEFGVILRANEHRDGYYKISAWVHKNNYLNARIKVSSAGALTPFNGEVVFAGNWVLMNHRYKRGASATTGSTLIMVASASGTIYVDDFRIHPNSSSMTSYVYNEWDELEAILGGNNLATKFEYDSQGRLITTYSETIDTPSTTGGFKKTSENFYNYKNQ